MASAIPPLGKPPLYNKPIEHINAPFAEILSQLKDKLGQEAFELVMRMNQGKLHEFIGRIAAEPEITNKEIVQIMKDFI